MRFGQGCCALITGGSSGIGLALARRLAERGMDLVLLARQPHRLEQARSSLPAASKRVRLVCADVTDPVSLQAAASGLDRQPIHLLVNSAGVVAPGLLGDLPPEAIDRQLATNLSGLIHATRTFMDRIPRGGAILNIASFSGLLGLAGYSAYSASKFGVIGFSEALRRELLFRGISVHVACSMDVDTPLYRGEVAAMPEWMRRDHVTKPRSAETEAIRILKGVERGRFLILTSLEARLFWILLRHLPGLSRLLADRIAPRPLTKGKP